VEAIALSRRRVSAATPAALVTVWARANAPSAFAARAGSLRRHARAGRADALNRYRRGLPVDNALAGTTIGLYQAECMRDRSPFWSGLPTTLADLEDHIGVGALAQHQQAHAPSPADGRQKEPRLITTLTSMMANRRSHIARRARNPGRISTTSFGKLS